MRTKRLLPLSLAFNFIGIIALIIFIQSMGGPRYLVFRLTNDGGDAMSTGRTEMFANLPIDSKKIMFLGDSLTQNGEWAELFNNSNIINRGVIGQWSGVLHKRLPKILNNEPGNIFLMTGINDLKAQSPKQVVQTLENIINELSALSPTSDIYLQSVLPINNNIKNTGRQNEDIILLNTLAQKICETEKCTYIPLHSHFTDQAGNLAPEYSHDGVHLNGAGYQKWQSLLVPYINTLV